MRVAAILGFLAATATSQAGAFERTQLLCGMREHCVEDKCDTTKGMPGGTPVVLITPQGREDMVEVGRYRLEFFADYELRFPSPPTSLSGYTTYRFTSKDEEDGSLRIGPWRPQKFADGTDGDWKERIFTFTRHATVEGRRVKVESSGECIDPTKVLLGYGMVPGIVRADELARRYSDPKNREGLIAYCTLSPVRAKGKDDVEMWLYHEDPDSPDLAFFGAPGSDALDALRRQKPPRDNVFIDDQDKGRKLIVDKEGQSRFFEREWTEPGKPKKPYVEYAGLCRKGGEW